MINIKKAIEQINPESFVKLYKTVYGKQMTDESIKNLVANGKKISEKILDNPRTISLLVGQVQAGKTATYSSVIANAFDNGSNFAVIAPATDNLLLEQTTNRIDDTFSRKAKVVSINSLFDKEGMKLGDLIKWLSNGEKVIILSLKHKKRLGDCKEVVEQLSSYIKSPILIDDEGDQASFDNKETKEANAVFAAMLSLYKSHKNMAMLTVTATPMPQIFVNVENDLKPDFAFYVEPGKEYKGLEYFMDPEYKFIREISDRDRDIISGKIKGILPKSFIKAVLEFGVASAYSHLLNGDIETSSMLIHIERKTKFHETIKNKVSNLVSNMIRDLQTKNNKYTSQVKDLILERKLKVSDEDFERFIELIVFHFKNTQSLVVNGGSVEQDPDVSSALHNPKARNYIYIGSNMLQRGVTIKNLVVTYFAYRSPGTLNADTVLQRARWFGYRKNSEMISLYLTEAAIKDFKALQIMTPEMTERLLYAEKENISFKEFERSIALPYADMKATRDSIVSNKRSKLKRVISDTSLKSSDEAETLFNRVASASPVVMIKGQPFKGIHFQDFNDVKEWIGKNELDAIFKELGIVGFVRKAFEDFIRTEKPDFYIANMYANDKDARIRTAKDGIISIAQGENNNYVGDRYWYKDASGKFSKSIIIQLNKIALTDIDGEIVYKISFVSNQRIHGHLIHALD